MRINRELSQELAKKVQEIPGPSWLNAVKALDFLPEQTAYIEGWIVEDESYQVLEHGWLELNGEIMDPSLNTRNVLEYFPGLKLRNPPKQGHLLPFVYHYGLHSNQFESYLEAFTNAQEFSMEKLKRVTSPQNRSNKTKPI